MLLLLLFLVQACSQEVKFTDAKREGPVVILGDSLAVGKDVPEGKGFVPVLSERLDLEIVNLGINGITTKDSIPRVEAEVLPLKPSLVILELGGNDVLGKIEPAETKVNLQTMIDELQKEKIPILILGVRGGALKDKLAGHFESLASDNGLAYVPDILKGILTSPTLRVDYVHPNDKGHELIADRVEPVLRELCQKLGLL